MLGNSSIYVGAQSHRRLGGNVMACTLLKTSLRLSCSLGMQFSWVCCMGSGLFTKLDRHGKLMVLSMQWFRHFGVHWHGSLIFHGITRSWAYSHGNPKIMGFAGEEIMNRTCLSIWNSPTHRVTGRVWWVMKRSSMGRLSTTLTLRGMVQEMVGSWRPSPSLKCIRLTADPECRSAEKVCILFEHSSSTGSNRLCGQRLRLPLAEKKFVSQDM